MVFRHLAICYYHDLDVVLLIWRRPLLSRLSLVRVVFVSNAFDVICQHIKNTMMLSLSLDSTLLSYTSKGFCGIGRCKEHSSTSTYTNTLLKKFQLCLTDSREAIHHDLCVLRFTRTFGQQDCCFQTLTLLTDIYNHRSKTVKYTNISRCQAKKKKMQSFV